MSGKTTLTQLLISQLKSLPESNKILLLDDTLNLSYDLLKTVMESRHTKTTIIIVVQDIKTIKPNIRINAISIIKTVV
jgi:hypothetical protein